MNVTKPEPLPLERGQGSSIVADRNDTHVLQHVDSQDWVVTDLGAPSEADERQLETTREPLRNEEAQDVAKELTSSSTSTDHIIESELL